MPTTSTTSIENQSLKEYNKLYSEYIQNMVELHNSHIFFSKYPGRESGFAVRAKLKSMYNLLKSMNKTSLAAWKEQCDADKYQKYLARVEKQRIKQSRLPRKNKKNG